MKYIIYGLFFAAMGPVSMILIAVGFNHIGEILEFLAVAAGLLMLAFTFCCITIDADIAERARLEREAESELQSRPAAMLLRPDAGADVNGLPLSLTKAPPKGGRRTPAVVRGTAWSSNPTIAKSPFFRG
jgi:hypothetical protein